MYPRKWHQMRHLCDLFCLLAKLGIPDDGDHRFRAIVITIPG